MSLLFGLAVLACRHDCQEIPGDYRFGLIQTVYFLQRAFALITKPEDVGAQNRDKGLRRWIFKKTWSGRSEETGSLRKNRLDLIQTSAEADIRAKTSTLGIERNLRY